MRGLFCNKCGKRMREDSVFFHAELFPVQNGMAIKGEETLFDVASLDFCPKCFRDEVERMRKEFQFPGVERSGDGTRYRAV